MKCVDCLNRAEVLKTYMLAKKKTSSHGEEKEETGRCEKARFLSQLQSTILVKRLGTKWTDVAGLSAAKQLLTEAVILPVKLPHLFREKRKPWKSILLFGPPGTGKSYLAQATATEADAYTFISVSAADLVSRRLGDSEKLVRHLFEIARERQPSIIFIDGIDAICTARRSDESDSTRRVKAEFLTQMQGFGTNDHDRVLVLGATNLPWDLDPAIISRFEKRVYMSLPDRASRFEMFKLHIGSTPNSLTTADLKELSEKTENYSGADISVVNVRNEFLSMNSLLRLNGSEIVGHNFTKCVAFVFRWHWRQDEQLAESVVN
ncbi:hypothetical protein EGW08_016953 [Elysia chlorotica]|uniref:AAA+ ATPase domain-containing protein n=1 Tax=Elysia chlorotica TaxID=188477 RepID=A0A433T1C5_ELYCH|nr:hypothetical protein EGW08_016953 [Elysia chlorotica]